MEQEFKNWGKGYRMAQSNQWARERRELIRLNVIVVVAVVSFYTIGYYLGQYLARS